jgi:hypothetical protein
LIDLRPVSRSTAAGLFAGLLVCGLLVAMIWKVLDHQPLYDELLHVFAARGLRDHGVAAIGDGLYERASWFTWMVVIAFRYLGDSLVAARIPSLLAAAALLFITTVWVTRRVNLLAGAAAGVFLLLLPATVDLAVFARFYTVHALLVVGMAIAAYEAAGVSLTVARRIALGVLAGVLCLLALQFQVTTLIGFGAVLLGVAAVLLLDHWHAALGFARRYPVAIGGGAVVAFSAGLAALSFLGIFDSLSTAPLWADYAVDRPQYYVIELARDAPLLWPLFPAAVVAAFTVQRRLTMFCVVAFIAAFGVHSAAAAKTMRYIYYALPFMCVILGTGLSGLYALLQSTRAVPRVSGTPALATLGVLAFVLAFSQEGQRAARLVAGRVSSSNFDGETDWISAVPMLEPFIASADRVVTSNSMKALYYFGRYDYELNASIVLETATGEEFGRDERTGGQAIGTAESTRKVLDMPGRALVVLEEEKLDLSSGVPTAAVETIAARCASVTVPPEAGIRAWTCPAALSRP